ncbi:hypothetical protein [Streptomyces sp. NBC_00439]|uniref:hypothetical protein n=1 Tax=Streptomyces sp. NBC_00439 TaxID=2903650 RepID=UPI00225C4299|nr:hypothetical protein [Streptomyces sp. NBC_00439]MCX5106572.1 hypothetical protein [Streptomyces sp. NBC_00439]
MFPAQPSRRPARPGGRRRSLEGRTTGNIATPFDPAPHGYRPWRDLAVESADGDFTRLVGRAEQDLSRPLLSDPGAPGDLFAGAGAPWFLTLFGRDFLWTALMLLPLGTGFSGPGL